MDDPGEYWVYVEGRGYFVRFESHGARPRWFTHPHMRQGYCFKTIADAKHVVDQIQRYGRTAKIVIERKAAPPPPPPPPIESPFEPPRRLVPWVNKIVAASSGGDVRIGYRALARQHHPDRGGKTANMQALSEAYSWLRANRQQTDVPLEPEAPFEDLSAPPLWEAPMWEPVSELTDDDIPF
jgi:hypothetical protein